MTTARKELVDVNVTRWYHCISRCVRGASLLGGQASDRKQWIADRLELLSQNFAIGVGGYAVMDNHLHVLCRLDPALSIDWSAEEVVRRWIAIYPPRNLASDDTAAVQAWIGGIASDSDRVEVLRDRLSNLGWFMKSLKEPLSRMANREDECRGAFWEARYKSIAVLDSESLLATAAYIDLNPLAAGVAATPESSDFTSLHERLKSAGLQGKTDMLAAAAAGSVAGSIAAGDLEESHWLVPLQDRRSGSNAGSNALTVSDREGMLESFSLGSYLLLVDHTARLYRGDKARLGSDVDGVFERLGVSNAFWSQRIKKMLASLDLRGSFFAWTSEKIRNCSLQRGKRTANLSPQSGPLPS